MSNINTLDVRGLLEICKRRLEKEEKIEQVEEFVTEQHGEEIWQ